MADPGLRGRRLRRAALGLGAVLGGIGLWLGVNHAMTVTGNATGLWGSETPTRVEPRVPMAEGAEVGKRYRYEVHTHCGIEFAMIDGTFWTADPPQNFGPGAPPGWPDPSAKGSLTLVSEHRARFEYKGMVVHFKRTDARPSWCR